MAAETGELFINPNAVEESAAAEEADISGPAFAKESGKYVTFRTGDEFFGIKIQYVNEIIMLQEITLVPETEDYIKGLINLRGKIIPVIDVRLRFKQEPVEYNDRTCIIVINVDSTVVGLIVEQITEVVELEAEDIIPSPSLGNAEALQSKYVYALGKVGDTVKLLLDPDKLLRDADAPVAGIAGDEE